MGDDVLYEIRPERNTRFIGHLNDVLQRPREYLKIAFAFGYSKATAQKRLMSYLGSIVAERKQALNEAQSRLDTVSAFAV